MSSPARLRDTRFNEFPYLTEVTVRLEDSSDPLSRGDVAQLITAAETRLAMRRRRWREAIGFVLSAAAAAAITAAVLPRLLVSPALSPQPGATFAEARPDEPARLSWGRLRGNPSRALAVVETPNATVAWTDARFLMEVTAQGTLLALDEGNVRWRHDGMETVRSAPARLRAPEPLALPAGFGKVAIAPNTDCSATRLDERLACLERISRGSTLAAQNALFEEALVLSDEVHAPERAVPFWSGYVERFPDGALAPDASIGLLADLIRLGRDREALAAAQAHRRRFPDAFPAEVQALEQQLAARLSKGKP
jgi:hypothetical protein